jgi:spermidine synthase
MNNTARLKPSDYIEASRVPQRLKPQIFGLWSITRQSFNRSWPLFQILEWQRNAAFDSVTFLKHFTMATLHQDGETVMEDGITELRRHLPIRLAAHGRVLITGLGLGCVVRGLLANSDVDVIDVVEIDRQILRIIGHEFQSNRRVRLHCCDALTWESPKGACYDFAYHDIWRDEQRHISLAHLELITRYHGIANTQDAWGMPRFARRILSHTINLL